MKTMLLATAIRLLLPVFLLFSIYMFFRGHNQPGGGFIAALVLAIGVLFHLLALGKEKTLKLFGNSTHWMIALGLGAMILSAMAGILQGDHLLEAYWLKIEIPLIGKLGTPILFDVGVYFVVLGISLTIAFALFEDESWK